MLDLLGVLGFILAISAAFDAIAPFAMKEKIAQYASQLTKTSHGTISPVEISDKFFGKKIFGVRALAASAVLTISFTILMGLIAAFLNFDVMSDAYSTIFGTGADGRIILAMAVVTTFVADFFSYAKARLLVRAMVQYRTLTVSSVVLAADLLASVILFAIVFSFGRIAMYVYLVLTVPTPLEISSRIAPAVIAEAADSMGLDASILHGTKPIDNNATDADEAQQLTTFANPDVLDAARIFTTNEAEAAAKIAETWGMSGLEGWNFIDRSHEVQCYTDTLEDNARTYQTYDAYANSLRYLYALHVRIVSVSGADDKKSFDDIDKAVNSAFDNQYRNGLPDCRIKMVKVNSRIDPQKMLANVAFIDLYLASLALNLSQTFDAIPSKFAVYMMPDLSAELPGYLSSVWRTRALSPSGYDRPSVRMSETIEDINVEEERAFLPFSTLVASALGATILLWGLIFAGAVSRLAKEIRMSVSEWMSYPSLQQAIFTSVALSLSFLCLGVMAIFWLINLIWQTFILLL